MQKRWHSVVSAFLVAVFATLASYGASPLASTHCECAHGADVECECPHHGSHDAKLPACHVAAHRAAQKLAREHRGFRPKCGSSTAHLVLLTLTGEPSEHEAETAEPCEIVEGELLRLIDSNRPLPRKPPRA